MRLTNTITLRAHHKSLDEHTQFKKHVRKQYGARVDFQEDTLRKEGFDDIHVITAKLYHQPPQKAFIHNLQLFLENKKELLVEAKKHLDARYTFFFRIQKESFYTNNWEFVHRGDVIQVRMNVCAHPKTQENALECVYHLLA